MAEKELYHIEECCKDNNSAWEELIRYSNQYCPFMEDGYLDVVGFTSKKYLVFRKNQPYLGIVIPISKRTGDASGIVPYAPYQGLIYKNTNEVYVDYHNNLDATTVLLDYLYSNSGLRKISFGNSYTVKDIRAVQWHHYHEREKGMYNVSLRYTCVLENKEDLLKSVSKGRKWDYNNCIKKYNIKCENANNDIREFMRLYLQTFERQKIILNDDELSVVEELLKYLIKNDKVKMLFARDVDGHVINASVVVYGNNTGYYLFGCGDPNYRLYGGGTFLLMKHLQQMRDQRIKYLDFVGANSPQRGDFKLSFGGKLLPYYVCDVEYI